LISEFPETSTRPIQDRRNECEPGPALNRTASLGKIARALERKPFRPHPLFTNAHAQTLAGYAWPRRYSPGSEREDKERLFEIEPGTRLLGRCRWQASRDASPTMILVHGLEGSSESVYMLSTAEKAFRFGFNVVRLNMRNCGGTEHLTPTLYHSGLFRDFLAVVNELIVRDRLQTVFLIGFSMSGNMALRLAGDDANPIPRQLAGICAVSPSVDLRKSAAAIESRTNRIYLKMFVSGLHRRMRLKKSLFPDRYDIDLLKTVRTIRDFDELYTARQGGYGSADDYYVHASSRDVIQKITVPTLIIHAQDDPFIPYAPLLERSIAENPYVLVLAPRRGGHVGFVADRSKEEDRFWAENRVLQFCRLLSEPRRV
jgi:predicted alpha/beta-fold hydrolase